MKKIEYAQLKETLYIEELDNGLKVYLLPKPEYSKTYAVFTTNYGSIDNHFRIPGGDEIKVPDGIAHFLEHKMFEQPNGEDVFQVFSMYGAFANAFTSFTRTAYLFSSTSNVEKNIITLLDFVQTPYFTDENVEKEKGIIGQEIRMYDDNPDWRSYYGLIEAMYHRHPVRIDIAGTIESINQITKEHLYQCYETFYHPSNMHLFVVGSFDPNDILLLIQKNQAAKNFQQQPEIQRFFETEPDGVANKRKETRLNVGVTKCMFGFKEKNQALGKTGDSFLKQILSTQIALEALIGISSDLYQSLYDDGLIDNSFGFDYSLEKTFGYSILGGDTSDHETLLRRIEETLPKYVEQGISQEVFERIRKKMIGNQLRNLNSPEWIANRFTGYRMNEADLFRVIPVLENLTKEDVEQRMKEHIDWNQFAVSIVLPTE